MDVNLGPEIRTDFRPQNTDVNDVPPLFAGAAGGREHVRSDPAKPLSTCDKMHTIVPEAGGREPKEAHHRAAWREAPHCDEQREEALQGQKLVQNRGRKTVPILGPPLKKRIGGPKTRTVIRPLFLARSRPSFTQTATTKAGPCNHFFGENQAESTPRAKAAPSRKEPSIRSTRVMYTPARLGQRNTVRPRA